MRAYPGRLRQRVCERPRELHVMGELEGQGELAGTAGECKFAQAPLAFRGAQRSSDTLWTRSSAMVWPWVKFSTPGS